MWAGAASAGQATVRARGIVARRNKRIIQWLLLSRENRRFNSLEECQIDGIAHRFLPGLVRVEMVAIVVPAEPLAVSQPVAVLEGVTGVKMDKAVSCDNIQMITSLVMQGLGVGILTSLDVITELRSGLVSFTRISDSILRPMTLALCTASARIPSHAASIVLHEIENSFPQLGYPASIDHDPELENR